MERWLWLCAGGGGFMGVALGAFGAHALRGRLAPELLLVWEKGVHYQLMHVLALMAVLLAAPRFPAGPWAAAGACFVAGTVLFSGSLYALALTGLRPLGAITPLGGVLFLVGWVLVAVMAWKGGPT